MGHPRADKAVVKRIHHFWQIFGKHKIYDPDVPVFFRNRKSDQIIDEDMTATERQFLIESLCEDIVPMMMEEYQLTDKEAFDKLYKSTTFSKVEDPETGLYYQSSVYVFDMLKEELNAGRGV